MKQQHRVCNRGGGGGVAGGGGGGEGGLQLQPPLKGAGY